MRRRRPQKVLGIALERDRALLAEVTPGNGGRRQMSGAAAFVFPPGVGLAQPAQLGAALGEFLRQQGLGTRDAILGLAARLLVTRRCDLPPAAADLALASLRLQAENAFASDAQTFVVDFAGPLHHDAAAAVLLVATSRTVVEQCRQVAAAAHLRLRAVTATMPALAAVTPGAAGDALVVSATPRGVELCLQHGGRPVLLRQAAPAAPEELVGSLAAEIRRILAGHPTEGAPWPVIVWDGCPAPQNLGAALQERLGTSVTAPCWEEPLPTGEPPEQPFAPAAAVALAGITGRLPVNFLRSRLAPPPQRRNRRRMAWATALGATVLLAAAAAGYNLHQRQANLAALQAKVAALRPQAQQARSALARLNFVRNWHSGKPRLLACFRALTNAFPSDGSIYATSLILRTHQPDELAGRAANQRQVLELRRRLTAAAGFTNVAVVDVRQVNPGSRQYEFSIAFKFRAPG